MTRTLAKTLVALGLASGVTCAFAQNDPPSNFPGWSICIDPGNTTPYQGWLVNSRATQLFRCTIGGSGTVTYGGQNSPCFTQAVTYGSAGNIAFASGPTGSIQDAANPIDDDMVYIYGMPNDPIGAHEWTVRTDPTTPNAAPSFTQFGTSLTGNFFAGFSGRYIYIEQTADGILSQVRMDVLADGAREIWTMNNVGTTPQQIGMWQGGQLGIMTNIGGVPALNNITGLFGDPVYFNIPGRKPLLVDGRIIRANDPANFPQSIQMCFGQTNAYGLEIELGPTPATLDSHGNSDATNVDELVVGDAPFIIGNPLSGTVPSPPPDHVFGDIGLSDEQYLIKYTPGAGGAIQANAARIIVCYYRNTWGNSRYIQVDGNPLSSNFGYPLNEQPYSSLVDAPHILTQDDTNTGSNGLANNPFTIRVYVDNAGGYGHAYTAVPIDDVIITLNLPAGMSMFNGDTNQKVISSVAPQELAFVEFQVESDGIVVGDLPYSVTITSVPGPPANQPITHTGFVRVSATKQIPLQPSANLVTNPWLFTDTSWEAVLAPLTSPADFTAYDWDPQQNGYVPSTGVARGKATWIILNPNTHPSPEVDPYIDAVTPTDLQSGAPLIQLNSGWNLIGDPYPYAIPISQLVGVSAANPSRSFTFADLINQNIVSPFLAYWDPSVGNYRYIQGQTAMLQPNTGYWIQILTSQDLTLSYPPVFDVFVPGGKAPSTPDWKQTASHWRVNLQAKANHGQDVENFVGVANGDQARTLQIAKPPMGPTQDLMLSIGGTIAGHPARMAQSMSDHTGQLQWDVTVQSGGGGPVTLSWPNMSTVPNNISFRLIDKVTRQSIDMRSRTSTTVYMNANSTRQFQVQSSASGSTLPVIGNITTAAGRLGAKIPATVNFSLNYNAQTSVQIVNSQGSVVRVLKDNENLAKGSNSAKWDLKNSSGSYVAAGAYQVVILAGGERKPANLAVNR